MTGRTSFVMLAVAAAILPDQAAEPESPPPLENLRECEEYAFFRGWLMKESP